MLTLFEFEFKLFFQLQGVLTENYEFANMKTERKFNKTMMNLYAFLFWDACRFFIFIFRKGNEKCYIKKIPSGRFWIMPNDFFEKYKLNSRDFMVYCFLVSKKDKKGKSYWSIRRMAEQCNMSYESVRRAIKSLEDQCLIDVEHCSVNGKKNSNVYTVHRLIWFCFLLLHFWCINNIKARNEKSEWKKRWFFNENLRLLDRFWGGFQAVDFKAG